MLKYVLMHLTSGRVNTPLLCLDVPYTGEPTYHLMKTTSGKDTLSERLYQWKTPHDLRGKQPQWKTKSAEYNFSGRQP